MKNWFVFLFATAISVQSQAHYLCSGKQRAPKAKITIATPQEDDYDIRYLKLDLSATNTSTAISGKATTVAAVVVSSMTDYYFELSNQLLIDSAKINGQLYTVSNVATDLRKISLGSPLAQNAVFTAEIYYHGAPTGGTGFFSNGILNQTTGSVQVTHTVSAAVHARDWYPCKQSLTDKIDSADIWISVPSGLKVASNGLLRNITPIGLNYNRYEWSTRYPVDYYLVSFAVAPYSEYNYFMHFPAGDSMLVQNYIYNDPSVLQQHQDELDSIRHIINYFSSIFGKYPFHGEKVGICMAPLGGGMENQTMVTLGSLDITLIAHELAHQWWGDNVTCQSLKDMWLNEGWATYCEQLFIEKYWGAAAARQERTGVFNSATAVANGSVYVDDTTSEGRIYSGRLTYNKGAGVAHMLRYMINNDTLFYQFLQAYHQQYKYKTATTEDFRSLAESVTGVDLDTFFQQWVYKEGYPRYTGRWAQAGSNVVIKVNQTTSAPNSVSVFKLPIELQLKSSQGDTIVRVPNDFNLQYYTINWSKPVDTVIFDPNNHIMDKSLPFLEDPMIQNVPATSLHAIEIFPNPAATAWQIRHLPAGARLRLTDINGRMVWEGIASSDTMSVAAAHLVAGHYVLTITGKDGSHSFQLTKP